MIDINTFYQSQEIFVDLPERVLYIYDIDISRYMISTWGRIYDKILNSYKPRELINSSNKYIKFELKNKNNENVITFAHRLVAATFLGIVCVYEKDQIINHKDGIKWHNEVNNLEWCDMQYNTNHAYETGLNKYIAENHPNALLTNDQYRKICDLIILGYYPKQINKIMNLGFDVSKIASHLRSGESEKSILKDYDFSNIPRNNYKRFSEDEVKYICTQFQLGNFDYNRILNDIGIDVNNFTHTEEILYRNKLDNIKNRISFINISKDYVF